MYNIKIHNIENEYEYNELLKIFLKPEEFEVCSQREDAEVIEINKDNHEDKNCIKREIYDKLSQLTGNYPA